jgi:uncharacterized protein YukE
MGYYENQLKTITSVNAWEISQLDKIRDEMNELQNLMTEIAASPGWTGTSADEAREQFAALRRVFNELETKLSTARSALTAANRALTKADNAHATLPGVAIPDWIYDEVKKATAGSKIWIPFVGEFAVESAISRVQEFFGAQRESAAYSALTTLQAELRDPRAQLVGAKLGYIDWPEGAEEPPGTAPSWRGDDNGYGGWGPGAYSSSGGGGGGGTSITSVPPRPGPPVPYCTLPPEPPKGWPHTTIGIDGEIRPGSLNGRGGGAGGLGGLGLGGSGGGGLGAGLLGAGAGAGALVVGSKLANGGGGLLGGAGAGAGAGGAGAGGGKSSSAMMGGAPGGGGGGSQKEKRNGLGLIAPKLEDDDETGPRAAAAGAGGRD